MKKYTYSVTLSIRHETVTPAEITDGLGLVPTHAGSKGATFVTQSGRELDRVNERNFWRLELADKRSAESSLLEDFLSSQNDQLWRLQYDFNA